MLKNILWDFDGVIVDSSSIRDYGFQKIFENFNPKDVDKLIAYHKLNGGLSRFHKIEYFFKAILKQEISKEEILNYAENFTQIMRKSLCDKKYLIQETLDFIKQNFKKYVFHIVSGSEHNELNFLCQKLEIDKFFESINGSPTPKKELIKDLMNHYSYTPQETILIGDSINDYEAANANHIDFYGYNNTSLKQQSKRYIVSFRDFEICS